MLHDPLQFTVSALAARGALLEPGESSYAAVLPTELARELDIPDCCMLHAQTELEPTPVPPVNCGFGSPVLEKLITHVRQGVPVASARLECDAPRLSQARSLGARFVFRNAVSEVTDVSAKSALYLHASFGWLAEADDRYEGRVSVVIATDTAGEPDGALSEQLDAGISSRLSSAHLDFLPEVPASIICERAERKISDSVRDVQKSVTRRLERDHDRIVGYFEGLIADLRAPRRRLAPAAMVAKLEHLNRERDAKLAALLERFTLRVSYTPLALLWVSVPVAVVRLRVRRRKAEAEFSLHLPAGSSQLDRMRCASCSGITCQPALCDDNLHPLCQDCAPVMQGRVRCGACRAR